jgi:hypothetical protein
MSNLEFALNPGKEALPGSPIPGTEPSLATLLYKAMFTYTSNFFTFYIILIIRTMEI